MGTITINTEGLVGNSLLSTPFTPECAEGETANPSTVDFIVPANTFYGVDLAAANAQASEYTTSNGQTYANENSDCVPDGGGGGNCTSYNVQPIDGSASIEWIDCDGNFQSATISSPTSICTDGSGYSVSSGSAIDSGSGSC